MPKRPCRDKTRSRTPGSRTSGRAVGSATQIVRMRMKGSRHARRHLPEPARIRQHGPGQHAEIHPGEDIAHGILEILRAASSQDQVVNSHLVRLLAALEHLGYTLRDDPGALAHRLAILREIDAADADQGNPAALQPVLDRLDVDTRIGVLASDRHRHVLEQLRHPTVERPGQIRDDHVAAHGEPVERLVARVGHDHRIAFRGRHGQASAPIRHRADRLRHDLDRLRPHEHRVLPIGGTKLCRDRNLKPLAHFGRQTLPELAEAVDRQANDERVDPLDHLAEILERHVQGSRDQRAVLRGMDVVVVQRAAIHRSGRADDIMAAVDQHQHLVSLPGRGQGAVILQVADFVRHRWDDDVVLRPGIGGPDALGVAIAHVQAEVETNDCHIETPG